MAIPAFVLCNDSIILFVKGQQYKIAKDDPRASTIAQALKDKKDESEVFDLMFPPSSPPSPDNKEPASSIGNVRFENNIVTYNGQPVEEDLTAETVAVSKEGLPVEPMLKFVYWVSQVESMVVRKEIMNFVKRNGLTINAEGFILGYKAVTSSYLDKYTRTIKNNIGDIVKINRRDVNDDNRLKCSVGLHVGSLEYVKNFGGYGDKMIIVQVNPRDIVCVPQYDARKMRVCEYKVIGHYQGELENKVYESTNLTNMYEKDDEVLETTKEPKEDAFAALISLDTGEKNIDAYENLRDSRGRFVKQNSSSKKNDDAQYHNIRDSRGRFCKR